MIEVKIIKDSVYNGNRLTTLELEYPKYIHAEVMTHRVFSRNAQSSRAIPVDLLIKKVEQQDWYPIFMKNKPGMEASEPLQQHDLDDAMSLWRDAKREAISKAKAMSALGVHKQIANRLLEPFSTIKVILSATEFDNFFTLRLDKGAQQEIQWLAQKMKRAMNESTPEKLDIGQWHLPYIKDEETILPIQEQVAISAARCARVSYLNHNNTRDIERDLYLHDTLVKEGHMSPTEHQATPSSFNQFYGNFKGWRQYRLYLENQWKVI